MEKGLSASALAEATHISVQFVEALEREDFGKMVAAIYVKGFIRLYAEHVGLDPDPLIADYLSRSEQQPGASALGGVVKRERPAPTHAARGADDDRAQADPGDDLFSRVETPPPPAQDAPAGRAAELAGAPDSGPARESGRGALGAMWRRCCGGVADLVRQPAALFSETASLKSLSVVVGLVVLLVLIVSGLSRCLRLSHSDDVAPAPPPNEPLRLALDPPDVYVE